MTKDRRHVLAYDDGTYCIYCSLLFEPKTNRALMTLDSWGVVEELSDNNGNRINTIIYSDKNYETKDEHEAKQFLEDLLVVIRHQPKTIKTLARMIKATKQKSLWEDEDDD